MLFLLFQLKPFKQEVTCMYSNKFFFIVIQMSNYVRMCIYRFLKMQENECLLTYVNILFLKNDCTHVRTCFQNHEQIL